MLKETGTEIVEIGHSERRHVFGETDDMENKKVLCALEHDLTPLLCIGETADQKRLGLSDEVLRTQLKAGLYQVAEDKAKTLMVAYEPVWAIGVNGIPASAEYVAEKHGVIRAALRELFGEETADEIPILYGGSVNNANATELIVLPNVDGLFIGRSAWEAENFNKIIRDCIKAKTR